MWNDDDDDDDGEDDHEDDGEGDHDGDDDLNPDQSELGAKVRMWVECLQRSNSLCLLVILMFRFS